MRRTILTITAASLVALGGAATALYFYDRPAVLRVAVLQGTEDFRLMAAAAHVFSRQHEPIRLRLVPVADAAASAAALEADTADLAVVRNDASLPSGAQTLVILHRNTALLIAPGGSSVRRIADLRGKKIGVVYEAGGLDANARLLETILAQYDVAKNNVAITPLTPAEARTAIEARQIDALFTAAVPNSGPVSDIVAAIAAASSKAPAFIPISEAKAIAKRFPALEPMEIVRGAFGGDPPRPATTFDSPSVSVLLVARSSLKDAIAGEATRLFLTDRTAIAAAAPLANNIEAPSTDKGSVVPVHQGAADYIDGNEHGFLDKYSDFIYIGAMLLSLVGSGAAALASRLGIRTHERTEHLTERLLEILQAARAAATGAELDGYEREVDEVLVHTLGDQGVRGVEGHGLHMVALALDQARRAIEERRRVLANEGRVVSFVAQRNLPAAE
ncbi:MAG: ABC transporter substrate-binding protein [Methylocystis sp.]|nr:ABC transporter substrate-binding protein [Methylocystis sp.]